jgi:hypothetical protein
MFFGFVFKPEHKAEANHHKRDTRANFSLLVFALEASFVWKSSMR